MLRPVGGGRIWDDLVFIYFSQLQRLRPLGFCAPLIFVFLRKQSFLNVIVFLALKKLE